MSTGAREQDELWSAVAEPARRQLLDLLLAHGEATATTLARDVPITRQAVVKHLALLDRHVERGGEPHPGPRGDPGQH